MHSHFGDFAFDRLPVSEAARFCLPQTRCDANLRSLVLQGIEPRGELFGLADGEHAPNVAKWIRRVKCSIW